MKVLYVVRLYLMTEELMKRSRVLVKDSFEFRDSKLGIFRVDGKEAEYFLKIVLHRYKRKQQPDYYKLELSRE